MANRIARKLSGRINSLLRIQYVIQTHSTECSYYCFVNFVPDGIVLPYFRYTGRGRCVWKLHEYKFLSVVCRRLRFSIQTWKASRGNHFIIIPFQLMRVFQSSIKTNLISLACYWLRLKWVWFLPKIDKISDHKNGTDCFTH